MSTLLPATGAGHSFRLGIMILLGIGAHRVHGGTIIPGPTILGLGALGVPHGLGDGAVITPDTTPATIPDPGVGPGGRHLFHRVRTMLTAR